MNIFNRGVYWVRLFSFKYLGKITHQSSGILATEKDDVFFYRGNKPIKVTKQAGRVAYAAYDDWKLVQTRKGKLDDLRALWKLTQEKQFKNWDFAGIVPGEIMLEVGFRDGYNLKHLQDNGIIIQGIEVNHDAVEAARALGCKAFEEDIQLTTHYTDKTFDVISACDVLEHCFAPENALREIYRILKDDGRVVIEIPFENEFRENLLHGHSTLFPDESAFESLSKKNGYRIVRKDTSNAHRNLFLLEKQLSAVGERVQ